MSEYTPKVNLRPYITPEESAKIFEAITEAVVPGESTRMLGVVGGARGRDRIAKELEVFMSGGPVYGIPARDITSIRGATTSFIE